MRAPCVLKRRLLLALASPPAGCGGRFGAGRVPCQGVRLAGAACAPPVPRRRGDHSVDVAATESLVVDPFSCVAVVNILRRTVPPLRRTLWGHSVIPSGASVPWWMEPWP